MIRHVVLLSWKDNTPDKAIDAVGEAFAKLATLIPGIRSYKFGPDLSIYDSNADYVLVADFDNEEDFKAYVVNPDHAEVMKGVTVPIMASFTSAQFTV